MKYMFFMVLLKIKHVLKKLPVLGKSWKMLFGV